MKEHFTLPGRSKENGEEQRQESRPETRHPAYAPESAPADNRAETESFNRDALEQERMMAYAQGGEAYAQHGNPGVKGSGVPSSARLFIIVALLFIIPLVIGVYLSGTISKDGDKAPMIKADKDPVRVKPDNPGGFLIDHQDKSVYETFSGRDADSSEVMKIIPATEMPANMAETDEGHTVIEDEPERMITEESAPPRIVRLNRDGKVPIVIEEMPPITQPIPEEPLTMDELVDVVTVPEEIVEEAVAEVTPAVDVVIPVLVMKGPVPTLYTKPVKAANISRARTVTPPAKKTLPPAAGDNRMLKAGAAGRYAQLGAFSNVADAKRMYERLAPKIGAAMRSGKVNYYFQPVSVSGKGTLYRLKIGEFAGEASVRAFCKKLNNMKIECMYAGY